MNELNQLLYDTVKNDSTFQSLAGASPQDPRFFKRKAPVRLEMSEAKPSFAVYYIMGTSDPGTNKIAFGQRNNRTYGIEVYGQTDTDVDELAELIEELFRDQQFSTTSFKVGHTIATRGVFDFDEGRKLWMETLMVHFNQIIE